MGLKGSSSLQNRIEFGPLRYALQSLRRLSLPIASSLHPSDLIMDFATLTAFIAPFLPFLLKLGKGVAETTTENAAGKFGEAAWQKAQAVWKALRPKVQAKESAKEAVTDVANNPEDEDLQVALRVQLKKLLADDDALADTIAQILQEDASDGTPGTQIVQNVTGNQNQVIGQATGGKVFGVVEGKVTINE